MEAYANAVSYADWYTNSTIVLLVPIWYIVGRILDFIIYDHIHSVCHRNLDYKTMVLNIVHVQCTSYTIVLA